MGQKKGDELDYQGGSCLRTIQDLKGDDAFEVCGRVSDNIRKVAVQRKQNCVQLLGLGGNKAIRGLGWKNAFQVNNLMPSLFERSDDLIGNTMVCEESQRH